MHVLLAASEMVPFAKTGGLADVAGALPLALARLGHRVSAVLPLHREIDTAAHGITRHGPELKVPGSVVPCRVWHAEMAGGDNGRADAYFIDAERYFDRPGLYGYEGSDFDDNGERYAWFCRAVLALADTLGSSTDAPPEVIHANDWQTAMLPVYLAEGVCPDSLSRTGSVLTIHNLAYQGQFSADAATTLAVPDAALNQDCLGLYGGVNFLKGGILSAHAVTTVSPTYATEILTEEFGCGLEGVVKRRKARLSGIVNGIDTALWNPADDDALAAPFSADDTGPRAHNRAALQTALGLPESADPVFGFVGRLAEQKGLDLLFEALDGLLAQARLVVLGDGAPAITARLSAAARAHPERMAVRIGFDEQLARAIYGGCDLFLMPSRFEPCGLSQLISMRYGAPPVVHRVGGLADTVIPFSEAPDAATGFAFDGYDADSLLACVGEAAGLFQQPERFARVRHNAMVRDSSWDASARRYETVYSQVTGKMQAQHGC